MVSLPAPTSIDAVQKTSSSERVSSPLGAASIEIRSSPGSERRALIMGSRLRCIAMTA
nr:hypothetical protein CPGR_01436 [Mycolicibacter nonchromogenicus]